MARKLRQLQEFWKKFVLLNLPENEVFPVEIFRWRKHAENFDQFLILVCENFGRTDIYFSINSPGLRKGKFTNRIVIDVDSPNLERAREVASDLVYRLYKVFRCEPIVVFTGKKGYQIHIVMDKLFLPGDSAMVYRKLCEALIHRLYGSLEEAPKEIDIHTFNYRALCRLPYTVHPGSGNFSLVVQDLSEPPPKVRRLSEVKICDFSVEETLRKARKLRDFLFSVASKYALLEKYRWFLHGLRIGRVKENGESESKSSEKNNTEDITKMPPCVAQIFSKALDGVNLEHWERFLLVTWLHHRWGWDVDKICEVFKYQPDYKPRVTRYQVEHILGLRGSKKVYQVPSCKWIREHGGCPRNCGRKRP